MFYNKNYRIVNINGNEYEQLEGMKYETDDNKIGYLAEGLPTTKQLELQDNLQESVEVFLDNIHLKLVDYGLEPLTTHRDIQTNFSILEEIWKHYDIKEGSL